MPRRCYSSVSLSHILKPLVHPLLGQSGVVLANASPRLMHWNPQVYGSLLSRSFDPHFHLLQYSLGSLVMELSQLFSNETLASYGSIIYIAFVSSLFFDAPPQALCSRQLSSDSLCQCHSFRHSCVFSSWAQADTDIGSSSSQARHILCTISSESSSSYHTANVRGLLQQEVARTHPLLLTNAVHLNWIVIKCIRFRARSRH